ncbi:MAG: hypothetical protein EAX96_13505 [Candidatus Lokiarchaeota archaeon]|nr:hypothetical protein [Candidatus Lokiarchaeota archaeon]
MSPSFELDGTGELIALWMGRILVTAVSPEWALTAARMASGFGYKDGIEAGIDLRTSETPDKRYGVVMMIAAPTKKALEKEMARRITQSIICTPTSSVFDYMFDDPEVEKVKVGDSIAYFADGNQMKGMLNDRTVWNLPSFDGDFFIESEFGMKLGVSTNIIIMGNDSKNVLQACMAFSEIVQETPGIMSPYPGGFTRFGFKLGSEKYDFMKKTLNTKFCPKLHDPNIPKGTNIAFQIILDALDVTNLFNTLKFGIESIENYPGITKITSSSFESKLGHEKFELKMIL